MQGPCVAGKFFEKKIRNRRQAAAGIAFMDLELNLGPCKDNKKLGVGLIKLPRLYRLSRAREIDVHMYMV